MNKIYAIAVKDWISAFRSPMAYIVLFLFTVIFNLFFFMLIAQNREASLRDMYKLMEFMFVFVIPLLTMKSFAEEKQSGTMEILQTAPVTARQVVLGKYLGTMGLVALLASTALVYMLILVIYGRPDVPVMLTGFLGVLLEAAFFTAIGVYLSSLTRNQVVAAVASYGVLFCLFFSIGVMPHVGEPLASLLRAAGTWHHLEMFTTGVMSVAAGVYYLAGIVCFLVLTRLSVESRIWK